MSRTRIVAPRYSTNVAVADITEASAMSEDVKRPRVAMVGGLRCLCVRSFIVDENACFEGHTRMVYAIKDQIGPFEFFAQPAKTDLSGNVLLSEFGANSYLTAFFSGLRSFPWLLRRFLLSHA